MLQNTVTCRCAAPSAHSANAARCVTSANWPRYQSTTDCASAAAGPEVYQSPNVDRVIAAWPHQPAPERIAALTQRRNDRLAALAAHKAKQNDKS